MRLYLTRDGKTGFALKKNGDIVSVFNTPGSSNPQAIHAMLRLALQQGGRKLDAFDTVLPRLYARAGFTTTARMRWNDEFAPPEWDKDRFKQYNEGEPDVVFMAYDPARTTPYQPGEGLIVNSYDEAVASQDRWLKEHGLASGAEDETRFAAEEESGQSRENIEKGPGIVTDRQAKPGLSKPDLSKKGLIQRVNHVKGDHGGDNGPGVLAAAEDVDEPGPAIPDKIPNLFLPIFIPPILPILPMAPMLLLPLYLFWMGG